MRYVALLRGINVGGNRKISMADLRDLVSSLGHADVSTYIQSGNVLFTGPEQDTSSLGQRIERKIASELGQDVTVIVRTRAELDTVIDGNPFQQAVTNPTTLHVVFLSEPPDSERLAAIDARLFEPDRFQVRDRAIYLWLPNGFQRTKLTNDLWERRLRLRATTRNWNTVTKLLALADG